MTHHVRKKAPNIEADEVAKTIVALSEDLEGVVKMEAARIICEEIAKVQVALFEVTNRLAIIVAGYRAGSLPKSTDADA